MSELGSSSDVQPTPPTGRRRHGWPWVAGAAGLALVLVAGTFIVLRDDAPSYPDAWDPRIEPFVAIVEEERGLSFEHPVEVRFLDPDEFEKGLRTDKDDLDDDAREDIERSASLFRAFGLISGDVDLFDAIDDTTGSGTLAYYSFDDRTITVRGTKLTRATHATLVHELTHALQDQHFDVADRLEDLDEKAADDEPTTAADALRGLVEGDAERVAGLYRQSLSAEDQTSLEEAETADTADALGKLGDIPQVVVNLIGAPYALGQVVAEAVATQGQDDLDDLFDDPPPDDSVLLDPLAAIDGADDSTDLEIPSTRTGEKKVDSGQIGSLLTYLMLAERIPVPEALAAADAWDGDAYVGFERDGVVCARVEYETGSDAASARLTSAFDGWIAADAGSTATVARDDERVTFESCDPGESAVLANDASTEAIELAAVRGYLGIQLLGSSTGASVDLARCLSRRLADEYPVADLLDPEFGGADDPVVTARIQELSAGCG